MQQKKTDKTIPLLKLLAGLGPSNGSLGLQIATVKTTEPDPITLAMEGTDLALDLDIFEVPVDCYPLRAGDQLLVYPLVQIGDSNRWAALAKLNGGVVMAIMQSAASCKPESMNVTYMADRIIIPGSLSTLQIGDRVSIAPTWDGSQIKYVIVNKY